MGQAVDWHEPWVSLNGTYLWSGQSVFEISLLAGSTQDLSCLEVTSVWLSLGSGLCALHLSSSFCPQSLPICLPPFLKPLLFPLGLVRVESSGPVRETWAKAQGEDRPQEQAEPKSMEKYQRGGKERGGQQKEQGPKVRIQKSGTAWVLGACLRHLLVIASCS